MMVSSPSLCGLPREFAPLAVSNADIPDFHRKLYRLPIDSFVQGLYHLGPGGAKVWNKLYTPTERKVPNI